MALFLAAAATAQQQSPATPLARLAGNIQRVTKWLNAAWGI
jgi:hypothetical protein